ncbi:hypothetical protein ACH4FX_36390 [Streptomyces sp. NPDC018019]|uniref:hypothetical protein n=1 Tax=Streptomyces sp. NPDC018019 TaxID=3365030 RepID=UPI0037B3DBA1
MALELGSMLMCAFDPDIGWVIAARTLQGIATGAASEAITASIMEPAPARHRRLGTVLSRGPRRGGRRPRDAAPAVDRRRRRRGRLRHLILRGDPRHCAPGRDPRPAIRDRASLFAAIFLVAYLTYGLPVIIAGVLIAPLGLLTTVTPTPRPTPQVSRSACSPSWG